MKKSSPIVFINVGIVATIISLAAMTSPTVAQTTTRTGNQDSGTTATYDRNNDNRNNDNSGLWGLSGLVGLLGLLGRRQEKDRSTTRRDDMPAYRDPNVR